VLDIQGSHHGRIERIDTGRGAVIVAAVNVREGQLRGLLPNRSARAVSQEIDARQGRIIDTDFDFFCSPAGESPQTHV
jgi:hypothetical protein